MSSAVLTDEQPLKNNVKPMAYETFYNRFGGSYRTKHLKTKQSVNKREYELPSKSELPKEFIRLEPWEGEYLFYLAQHATLGVVETGRFHGGSTFTMACANTQIPIHSIDIAPQNDAFLQAQFSNFKLGKNVDMIVGDSQKSRYEQIKQFDMLFIDGDHSYEGCTNDLENWYPLLATGGHVVLHDSYHGSEVKESVIDFISKHNKEVEVVVSPYKNREHWFYPEGSLAHFIKR